MRRARSRLRFRVIASHHPALLSFVLSTWRWRWCARLHALAWIHVLGDGRLWPDAHVEEVVVDVVGTEGCAG